MAHKVYMEIPAECNARELADQVIEWFGWEEDPIADDPLPTAGVRIVHEECGNGFFVMEFDDPDLAMRYKLTFGSAQVHTGLAMGG